MPVLAKDGFKYVELFGPHATPNRDFPNVPGHVANPENPPVFDAISVRAKEAGAEVALATDPDCDRIGCAAAFAKGSPWHTLTGNQLCAVGGLCVGDGPEVGPDFAAAFLVETLVTARIVQPRRR